MINYGHTSAYTMLHGTVKQGREVWRDSWYVNAVVTQGFRLALPRINMHPEHLTEDSRKIVAYIGRNSRYGPLSRLWGCDH